MAMDRTKYIGINGTLMVVNRDAKCVIDSTGIIEASTDYETFEIASLFRATRLGQKEQRLGIQTEL